jgi:hypothetical protein
MRRTIGGNSQDRRRARRAASRRLATSTLSREDIRDIQDLVAAASGSTGLPLSDRGTAWDASAADKAVRAWAGADDAPNAKYGQAFFIKDGDGSQFGDYHLPFATVMGGKLTAVWRGVTAAAAALQGSRGANVEGGDAAKPKIESYYAKARQKYGDDSIKVPWAGNESAGETAAFLLAYADSAVSRVSPEADIVYAWYSTFEEDGTTPREDCASVYSTDEAAMDEFEARLSYWEAALDPDFDELFEMLAEPLGGRPSQGTKKDKRLKGNKPGGGDNSPGGNDGQPEDDNMSAQPELDALAAIEDFAASVKCGCGHAYSEHSGAGGSCGHEDGRGTCRCGEFAYPESDVTALADAIVSVRPDLSGFEAEIAQIARRTLLALEAAAGDVAWGPEDGFMDLLCDVNEALHSGGGNYYEDGPSLGPRCVDASVDLKKVLICDGDDYFVAPITIDGQGEPVLSDKTDWVQVESGWIESPDDDADEMAARPVAMQMRFALRDMVITADGATETAIPEVAEVLPEASDEITPPETLGAHRWVATFVPEGVLTEDGRTFAPGSVILPPDEQARQLPLTLMGLIETSAEGGHDRAKVAGRIDEMWREEGTSKIKASGVFSEDEWGQKIEGLVDEKSLTGLSVDIAPLNWEHVRKEDWFNEDGEWIAVQGEDGEWSGASGAEPNDEDLMDALFNGTLILAITKAVIGMATVCPFPAFGGAEIALTASGIPTSVIVPAEFVTDGCGCGEAEIETVTASAVPVEAEPVLTAAAAGLAPVSPPADWFAEPEFDELTPLTITDEGRIFGHAWQWDTCHLSFDQCVTAPHSATNYAYYLLGEIECEDGERLAVGKVTLDAPHAGTRLTRQAATAHYDNTGTVAAHVTFGEDEFGGWFAGAINPELSEEKVRLLRGSTVSGDWRGVDGNLELVALLACNVPGFPVPRSLRASMEMVDDEAMPVSLVAAGIVQPTIDEIRDLASEAIEG